MKDHERRELVNRLTKIAREYGQTQQLRERIAHELLSSIKSDSSFEAYDKGRADQAVDDLPGELQIAAMGHDAQRITGENAVLRDLLRDAMDVMWAFGQHGGDWIASKILEERITAALKSSAGVPSDGQIYAAASRRAAPEWHAEMDKLLGISDEMKK